MTAREIGYHQFYLTREDTIFNSTTCGYSRIFKETVDRIGEMEKNSIACRNKTLLSRQQGEHLKKRVEDLQEAVKTKNFAEFGLQYSELATEIVELSSSSNDEKIIKGFKQINKLFIKKLAKERKSEEQERRKQYTCKPPLEIREEKIKADFEISSIKFIMPVWEIKPTSSGSNSDLSKPFKNKITSLGKQANSLKLFEFNDKYFNLENQLILIKKYDLLEDLYRVKESRYEKEIENLLHESVDSNFGIFIARVKLLHENTNRIKENKRFTKSKILKSMYENLNKLSIDLLIKKEEVLISRIKKQVEELEKNEPNLHICLVREKVNSLKLEIEDLNEEIKEIKFTPSSQPSQNLMSVTASLVERIENIINKSEERDKAKMCELKERFENFKTNEIFRPLPEFGLTYNTLVQDIRNYQSPGLLVKHPSVQFFSRLLNELEFFRRMKVRDDIPRLNQEVARLREDALALEEEIEEILIKPDVFISRCEVINIRYRDIFKEIYHYLNLGLTSQFQDLDLDLYSNDHTGDYVFSRKDNIIGTLNSLEEKIDKIAARPLLT